MSYARSSSSDADESLSLEPKVETEIAVAGLDSDDFAIISCPITPSSALSLSTSGSVSMVGGPSKEVSYSSSVTSL